MYELQVQGMSCNHCVGAVTRSVLAVDAQAKVVVDLAAGKVRVESQKDLGAITEAVSDAGYEVTASSIS